MIKIFNLFSVFFITLTLMPNVGFSHSNTHQTKLSPIHADGHAPIGVMGDHRHKTGEWMFSYRFMQMNMKGNIQGNDSISPQAIVSSISNPNAPPANVRVAALEMTTQMHMFGAMYAPSDVVTLMFMINYIQKEMDHLTFTGMMGANELGTFSTKTSGLGDTKLSSLWKLLNKGSHRLHLNLGMSIPTGSIDESDHVLTPMNTRPIIRLPYAMQLGSGTYDFIPGITYYAHQGKVGWGAQWTATLRLGDNENNYTLGDKQAVTGWTSYRVKDGASLSLRLTYRDEEAIDGKDDMISAPVTTANPNNYGGNYLGLTLGANIVGQRGTLRGHRIAIEYESTLNQNAHGVQLEMDNMITLGYQYAF